MKETKKKRKSMAAPRYERGESLMYIKGVA